MYSDGSLNVGCPVTKIHDCPSLSSMEEGFDTPHLLEPDQKGSVHHDVTPFKGDPWK